MPGIERERILDLLSSLAAKSLVTYDTDAPGGGRYGMLETIREYAQARLDGSGEAGHVRRRHRDRFLAVAQEARSHWDTPAEKAYGDRLEASHDNLRAALADCGQDPQGAGPGLRMAAALGRFWERRGYLAEGRAHLEAALERSAANADPSAEQLALEAAGSLCYWQSDYAAAQAFLERGLALNGQVGNTRGKASSLHNLGLLFQSQCDYVRARGYLEESLRLYQSTNETVQVHHTQVCLALIAHEQGDYAMATEQYERSLAFARDQGDTRGMADGLCNLGNVAHEQGDFDLAWVRHQESLALRQEMDDPLGVAQSLGNLGNVAFDRGDLTAARALQEESLALRRGQGNRLGIALTLNNLGTVIQHEGDHVLSRALFQEGLSLFLEMKDQRCIAYSLESLASVSAALGQFARAARLWGAAEALRERIGTPLAPMERDGHDADVAGARGGADRTAWEAAWAEGREISLEQAVALALEETNGAD